MKNKAVEDKDIFPDLPIRMCVICRRRFGKPALTRHVLDSSGVLIPDIAKNRPGRGWYCCQEPQCKARFASYRPRIKTGKSGKAAGR